MPSWLESFSPKTFDDLAMPKRIRGALSSSSVTADPPHLLLTGPAGVGKTAAWKLVARQILGPGWKSTTHVLQCRDLARQSGAMAKFEDFLRPGGSTDTLAGRTSLDAFDRGMAVRAEGDKAPAGFETIPEPGSIPVSRLIVLEDADHLGSIRQAYLRRMMEKVGNASRFILVARAPSRIIDALRSRSRMIRIPATDREQIVQTLASLAEISNSNATQEVIEDVAYICDGNLRKAIFTLEMLDSRNLGADRSAVHKLVQATTLQAGRYLVELALRGRVVEWKWENKGGRRKRTLVGALAEIDRLMNEHGLDADDVVQQLHGVLVGRRLSIPDPLRDNLLDALAECDTSLKSSMHARVPLERFLHRTAEAGELHGLAFT
ncbi:MAG: AAA family ATPase [Candidatus Thalassarchaeaceae archaeon]